MKTRSHQPDLDVQTPGGGISPGDDTSSDTPEVLDVAPSASEEEASDLHQKSDEVVGTFIADAEASLNSDRGRQTLMGAVLVARSIIYAGVLISNAIRDSRNTPS